MSWLDDAFRLAAKEVERFPKYMRDVIEAEKDRISRAVEESRDEATDSDDGNV